MKLPILPLTIAVGLALGGAAGAAFAQDAPRGMVWKYDVPLVGGKGTMTVRAKPIRPEPRPCLIDRGGYSNIRLDCQDGRWNDGPQDDRAQSRPEPEPSRPQECKRGGRGR